MVKRKISNSPSLFFSWIWPATKPCEGWQSVLKPWLPAHPMPEPHTRSGERSSCHWRIPEIPDHFCITTKMFPSTWISVITRYSGLKKRNLSMVSFKCPFHWTFSWVLGVQGKWVEFNTQHNLHVSKKQILAINLKNATHLPNSFHFLLAQGR